jgi:hypothetical protein
LKFRVLPETSRPVPLLLRYALPLKVRAEPFEIVMVVLVRIKPLAFTAIVAFENEVLPELVRSSTLLMVILSPLNVQGWQVSF